MSSKTLINYCRNAVIKQCHKSSKNNNSLEFINRKGIIRLSASSIFFIPQKKKFFMLYISYASLYSKLISGFLKISASKLFVYYLDFFNVEN